jgi:CBS domain-containing protein
MGHSPDQETSPRLILEARTAADLMTPNPLSIRESATVWEATAFLADKGVSAAPVIDEAGHPVGVLSRADVLVHDRETVDYRLPIPAYYEETGPAQATAEVSPTGLGVEDTDFARVRDIMTPAVFSVAPATPASQVVADMLGWKVHRLFVVGDDGVLVGVISALDVLEYLRPEAGPVPPSLGFEPW